MVVESLIIGCPVFGTSSVSFIASSSPDILFCSELAVNGLPPQLSSTPESPNPLSYIPIASSTLIPSSLPKMDVAELLFVITLLLSVPLVPMKLELVVNADRKLARISSLSRPVGRAIGSHRCAE
jgi:hypothetical protein